MKRPGTAAPPLPGWGGTGGSPEHGAQPRGVGGHTSVEGVAAADQAPDGGGPTDDLHVLEAVVHSGGVATPYLRCGRGPPLLFLRDPGYGNAREDPVLRILARGFLVIVPLLPAGAPDRSPSSMEWIRPFLEGLGLDSPEIVIRMCPD